MTGDEANGMSVSQHRSHLGSTVLKPGVWPARGTSCSDATWRAEPCYKSIEAFGLTSNSCRQSTINLDVAAGQTTHADGPAACARAGHESESTRSTAVRWTGCDCICYESTLKAALSALLGDGSNGPWRRPPSYPSGG